VQKQIPFEDDRKKSKGNGKSNGKSNGKRKGKRRFPSGMTKAVVREAR
jgi:hypothetical protein